MRISPYLAAVGIAVLVSCSSPSDVLVTRSDDHGSRSTETPVTSVVSTTSPPAVDDFDPASLLLIASDLPDWNVTGPMTVPEEPTWEALNCPDMNVAWAATGRGGTRSRGSADGIGFRNTVVEFDSTDDAGAVLDAVDRVWIDCVQIESELGMFWSEPLDAPTSEHRMAGLMLGGDDVSLWALGFWQVDHAVVVLELEGDELWTHFDQLFATMSARVDGVPTPSAPPTNPNSTPTTTPGQNPPVNTTLPTSTVPSSSTTVAGTDAFPPADEDWFDHRLAPLAPSPAELGEGWTYRSGYSSTAEPADPDDAIPGCDTPIPPTLDGLSLDYSRDMPESELELELGEGSPEDAQVLIDAVRAVVGCDLGEVGFVSKFDVSERQVDGADDSVVITGRADDGNGSVIGQVIVVGRVDGLSVAVFVATMNEIGMDEAEVEAVDLVARILSAR